MTFRLRRPLLPLLAASLAACSNFVEGNGSYAERVLDAASGLPPFTSVAIGFPGDVDVSGHPLVASVNVGAQARLVILSGDENVIEHIKIHVDGSGRLSTSIDVDGYTSVHPPQLMVNAPELGGVEAQGGADVGVHDAPAADLSVAASNGGHVVLEGSGGGDLRATLQGGSQLDATAYQVQTASLTLTGASAAKIWPIEAPTGSAADGSKVEVKGPAGCGLTLSGGSTCGPLP